jgi:hypothetical protein
VGVSLVMCGGGSFNQFKVFKSQIRGWLLRFTCGETFGFLGGEEVGERPLSLAFKIFKA